MEIAKLFASVGFRVDTTNLEKFESKLGQVQTKFVGFSQTISAVGTQASTAIVPVNNLLKALDFKGKSTGITPLVTALGKLSTTVNSMNTSEFHSKIQKITLALEESRPSIWKSKNAWEAYAKAVAEARAALGGNWGGPPRIGPNNGFGGPNNRGGGGFGGGYVSSPHYTPASRLLAPMVGSHLAYLGSGGIMAGAGAIYATKATLDRAQENVTAENFVKMASKDDAEFKQNRDWLWERSQYYGTDINANMEGFGKIYMNTIDSLGRKASLNVIEDIMKYNTAMHTSREAQKFINKSLYQMAGTAQVNAQDYNQWEEHVAGGNKVASSALDILANQGKIRKDWRELGTAKKAISELKLEGKDLVPALTQAMAKASSKGLETGRTGYQAQQTRFQNQVTQFARDLADGGLFDMAKNFFKLLSTIMDVMKAMMPIWTGLAKVMGFFFENLALGIEAIKEFLKYGFDFISFLYETRTGALIANAGFALLLIGLWRFFSGFKKFMTAVKLLMASNPILLALMAIITVLGFLYGQWKAQQEGLDNWLDVFTDVLTIAKFSFLEFVYNIQSYFFMMITSIVTKGMEIKTWLTDLIEEMREMSKVVDLIVTGFEKVEELRQRNKKNREDLDAIFERQGINRNSFWSPMARPIQQPATPSPSKNAFGNGLSGFTGSDFRIRTEGQFTLVDQKGKPLGTAENINSQIAYGA